MAAVSEPSPESGANDPYQRLGLKPGASFEAVQDARERCITEAGDDPQLQAKIEAAYDAVLMSRLRDRQDGQLSQAAARASAREEVAPVEPGPAQGLPGVGVVQRLRAKLPDPTQSFTGLTPQWSLAEGQGLIVRLIGGSLGLLFLVFTRGSTELILSLAVIGAFISSVRRGRRALPALGWSLFFLVAGLLIGVICTSITASVSLPPIYLGSDQIQALPALLLLWVSILFLA